MQTPAYKRVLLKLSGEALKNDADTILDFDYIDTVVSEIKRCVQAGERMSTVQEPTTWVCSRRSSIPSE